MLNNRIIYFLFFSLSLIVLAYSFFKGEETLHIPLHDIYYGIGFKTFYRGCFVVLSIFGIIYWLLRDRKTIALLSYLHFFASVFILIALETFNFSSANPTRYYQFTTYEFSSYSPSLTINKCLIFAIGLQFLWGINIMLALIRGRRYE